MYDEDDSEEDVAADYEIDVHHEENCGWVRLGCVKCQKCCRIVCNDHKECLSPNCS